MHSFLSSVKKLKKEISKVNPTPDVFNNIYYEVLTFFLIETELPALVFENGGFAVGDATPEELQGLVDRGLIFYDELYDYYDFTKLDELFLEKLESGVADYINENQAGYR